MSETKAERPSAERLAKIRRMVVNVPDCLCPADLDELFAEIDALTAALDAEKARAKTAEDALAAELSARNLSGEVLQRCDAVLNGPPPETHWRSLHDVDVQVAALKARAQTAEDALARLLDAAEDFREAVRDEDAVPCEASREERAAAQAVLGDLLAALRGER